LVLPDHHETRVRHVGEAENLVIAQVVKLLLDNADRTASEQPPG